MPKFHKGEEELVDLTDKWLYFMKEARRLNDIPEAMQDVDEIKMAFQIANQASLTDKELDAQERHEMFVQGVCGALTRAQRIGREEGLAEGLAKGEAEGQRQNAYEIAKQLLAIMEVEAISKVTGLSVDEIRSL